MKHVGLVTLTLLLACEPIDATDSMGPEPRFDDPSDPSDPSDPDDPTTPPDDDPVTGYPSEVTDVLDLPETRYRYAPEWPAHFDANVVAAVDNTPNDNPVTDAGATLGRVLFYDTALSANRTVACGSCHLQSDGFSDPAEFSEGFEGGLTGRNSMGLANLALYRNGAAFWDERAESLEEQVLMPIQDAVEMGLTLEELVTRVEDEAHYPALFTYAFGDATVTSDRISRALAQFVRSITSTSSRFDAGLVVAGDVGQDFASFTPQENRGKDLFFSPRGNCAVCHVAQVGGPGGPPGPGGARNQAIFFMDVARNNGLDATTTDPGLGEVTGRMQDDGKFKSPSLRNIAVTGPYMHDGRLETLEDVVEHYDSGVQDHPNLDGRLRRGGQPQRLNLSAQERAALVAFLETLTDDVLAEDPRFADPFR
ncbi:MAG: cytochrome c peroxidase [Myxococcota bacterium]